MAAVEDSASKLQKLERQLERERKYNAELSKQNDELSQELSRWRGTIQRVTVATQTEEPQEPRVLVQGETEWTSNAVHQGESIADSVKSFLTKKSQEIQSKEFIFNEALGMYVNSTNGMMYDGERYLYYDYEKNLYMFFDQESGTYKEDQSRKAPTKTKPKRKKTEKTNDSYSSSEEGEVDDESSEKASETVLPCVRMIVYGSSATSVSRGDLYIATCDRVFTFGRDPKRDMVLEEDLVSKFHAKIIFEKETSSFRIQDFGSQNGTFLNNRRLSSSKEISEKEEVTHQDLLTIGSTTLILHIHENLETCDDCEPGVVLARTQETRRFETQSIPESETSIKQKHKQKMLEIKKKYGLVKEQFVGPTTTAVDVPDYVDRSKIRRAVIGSDHPSVERPAISASVHVPIAEDNKGFKMLSKMGWNEGEGLNSKRKADSINAPISTMIRLNETAGLGSDNVGEKLSMDDVKSRQQKEKWIKTAKRYHGLATYTPAEKQAASGASGSKSGNTQWVRGGVSGLSEDAT